MAPKAFVGAAEARVGIALGARPVAWTCPRATRAPLRAASPPGTVGAVAARAAAAAASGALPMVAPSSTAATKRLQQTLLLRGLLTKSVENLVELAAAVAARRSIMGAACAALPPPATAHRRRGGVMRGDKVGGRRHAQQGARGAALAPRTAVPGRFPRALRRDAAARRAARGPARQGQGARGQDAAERRRRLGRAATMRPNGCPRGEPSNASASRRRWRVLQRGSTALRWASPRKSCGGSVCRGRNKHPPSEPRPDPLEVQTNKLQTATQRGKLCR